MPQIDLHFLYGEIYAVFQVLVDWDIDYDIDEVTDQPISRYFPELF